MTPLSLRGFYAILDAKGDPAAPLAGLLRRGEALLAARPCCLQLRAKSWPAAAIYEAARALVPLCRAAGVPFCMNDRVDLAIAVEADVVHVGQDDLPFAEVRRLLSTRGSRMWIGVSTHNPVQAAAAAAAGADYIGFGPVFPTRSKANPDPVVGLAGLAAVCAVTPVPVVAIGGLTRALLADVVAAGADAAAVISDVESAADPTAAGREIAAAFPAAA